MFFFCLPLYRKSHKMVCMSFIDNLSGLEAQKIRLLMHLRRQGITCSRTLEAIETIPREIFIPSTFQHQSYEDMALPIGLGQTISQPVVVATMTQSLEISDRHKILEIGTGSGYQAAILSKMCRRLYTIERHKPLGDLAQQRFDEMRLRNITAMNGDGMKGWTYQAPFDRIIVTAAAHGDIPRELMNQLAIGGIMVAPIGPNDTDQTLMKITRIDEDTFEREPLFAVRFVPLLPEIAEETKDIDPEFNQMTACAY
jgi:protein-L-isoaspartate(D-aspartate) O-methyltransferase